MYISAAVTGSLWPWCRRSPMRIRAGDRREQNSVANIPTPDLKGCFCLFVCLFFNRRCQGVDSGWWGCNIATCSWMQSRGSGVLAGQTGHPNESPGNERPTAAAAGSTHRLLFTQVGHVELGGGVARLGSHGVIQERREPAEPPMG